MRETGPDNKDCEQAKNEDAIENRLAAAKANFANAGKNFEPLGIVERNPVKSVAGAFLLGFGITRVFARAQPLSPLLAESTLLMLRYFLRSKK